MTITELQRWLSDYKSAWEQRDTEAAARLFAADALYYDTPYAEPFRGPDGVKAYWSRVTPDQRDVVFESEPVGVIDDTGIATWRATFRSASSGDAVELRGVFVLDFDGAGLCTRLREWWHVK